MQEVQSVLSTSGQWEKVGNGKTRKKNGVAGGHESEIHLEEIDALL